MEGNFADVVDYFAAADAGVAAHYVVRAVDGRVVQMVDEREVAAHAACANDDSIGVELEGFGGAGDRWFDDVVYGAAAGLVADIAARYDLPVDEVHVKGHEDVGCSTHTDPGAQWDWDRFFAAAPVPP
jgi:N-acetyl-anhydromuramyl-L-alanine amidase AmpD